MDAPDDSAHVFEGVARASGGPERLAVTDVERIAEGVDLLHGAKVRVEPWKPATVEGSVSAVRPVLAKQPVLAERPAGWAADFPSQRGDVHVRSRPWDQGASTSNFA